MLRTIKSSREIDELFKTGARGRDTHAVVIAAPILSTERGPMGRVAFVAGKRLGNAVLRNRSRRVLREAARRCGAPWSGSDVVIMAVADTATCSADDLAASLARALSKAGVQLR